MPLVQDLSSQHYSCQNELNFSILVEKIIKRNLINFRKQNYFKFNNFCYVGMNVTDCGVIEHLPDLGHWVLDSDLLFKGLRN